MVTDENTSWNVAHSFVEIAHNTIRRVSNVTNVSRTSVYRILRLQNFHPHKITSVVELVEDLYDRRLEFAEIKIN